MLNRAGGTGPGGGGSGTTGSGSGGGQETPISKYLANLERRKSIFLSSSSVNSTPSPSINSPPKTLCTRGPAGLQMRIDFNDTWFNGPDDGNQSFLHLSPANSENNWNAKKRRLSLISETRDAKENYEELQRKNAELERLLRQTQAELIDGRAAYSKLDQINIETRLKFQEKIIQYDKAEEEMKIKTRNAVERAEILEKQLQKYRAKDTEQFQTAQNFRQSQSSKLSQLEAKVQELEKENFDIKQKIQVNNIDHEKLVKKLTADLEETEKSAEKWIMDLQITKDQLHLAQSQLAQAQAEVKAAQLDAIKLLEFKSKYESVLHESESANNDVAHLQERVKKYENLFLKEQLQVLELKKSMQKIGEENGILRSTIKSEMLLNEQITGLESKVKFLENQVQLKSVAESQIPSLQNEIKQWKNVGFKLDSACTTPLSLESALRSNQELLLNLKHENSELSAQLKSSQRNINNSTAEIEKLKTKLAALEEEKAKMDGDYKKLYRRMTLLVQDRDNLMALKSSYEQEYEGLISEPLKNRVEQLESIVKNLELLLKETACKYCPKYQEELKQLKQEKTKLSETIVQLNETIANEPTTAIKVVSFGQNPSLLSIEARLQNCLEENNKLKERLRKFEEDTMASLPDEELIKAKNRLEEDYRLLEHRHQILTDSYDFETVQLQNVLTKLFGYYVTLLRGGDGHPNQIKLQSIYSHVPDHCFMFQDGEGGEFLLLDTPVLEDFSSEINQWLQVENSIPGFLSSVTISHVQSQGSDPTDHNLSTHGNLQIDVVQGGDEEEDPDSESEEESTIQIQSVYSGGTSTRTTTGTREIEVEIGNDDSEAEEDDEDEPEQMEEEEEEIKEASDEDDEEEDDDDVVTLD